MEKVSLAKSISEGRCPNCRQGNLFTSKVSNLKSFHKMNDACDHCGQSFSPEPSFYMGAMFVSYGLQIGLFVVSFFTIRSLVPDASIELYMGVMIGLVVLTLPIVYRLSRSIWIHLMVRRKKSVEQV